MLLANTNVWETRIQNVDALLTARGDGRDEVYYLATVCQVGVDPPLLSISPNPEYPICDTIEAGGRFAINFLAKHQGDYIERCAELERQEPDKLGALKLPHELSTAGTPLLTDCIQSVECEVEEVWDSGDHRTFVGRVIDRRIRGNMEEREPRRFRGGQTDRERLIKQLLCRTRVYDLMMALRSRLRPPVSIAEGTAQFIGSPHAHGDEGAMQSSNDTSHEPAAAAPAAAPRSRVTPAIPGICLVGCGWWGGVHALELRSLGKRVRRFFASRDLERARGFERRFDGEDSFDGLDAALADPRVDAVVLSLPHHLHADAARQALTAGKHVLVEKPLCLGIEEGEELVRAAEASGLCLAVAEQYRLSPLARAVRRHLDADLIGRVSMIHAGVVGNFRPAPDWKNQRDTMGGGVLLDVGVHYIDILRSWFGEPEFVWSVTPPHLHERFEGEDSITTVLRFPDGPVANLTISWSGFRDPDIPNIEVIGERGSLQVWFRKPYVVHSAPLPGDHWSRRLRRLLPWQLEERARRFLPQSSRRRLHVPDGDLIGSRALIEDFVLAITTGGEPGVSGSEGLRDLRVVLGAYQAMEEGRPIPLGDRSAA